MTTPLRWSLFLLLAACGDKNAGDDTGSPLVDADGDGFDSSTDCDDEDPEINPDAIEICDGIDNDCDDSIDDNAEGALTWYLDADGDGFGDDEEESLSCEAPSSSHTLVGGDCDDSSSDFHPDASEDDCTDPNDYNCDGSVSYEDADGDGFPACELDCDDADPLVNPDALEVCDGVDNDCDGDTDDADDSLDPTTGSVFYGDTDEDGYGNALATVQACTAPDLYVDNDLDCDDGDATINPDGVEVCDEADNDCDGTVDEDDATDATTWYADTDSDAYGDADSTAVSCEAPPSYVADATDCDDTDTEVNPGATEVCDEVDNDCDGDTDEDDADDAPTWYADLDSDDYGVDTDTLTQCQQPTGYVATSGDCDDDEALANPGETEVCGDGIDNDCDETANGCDLSGDISLADADAIFTGEAAGDLAGESMATVGDQDGDGFDDFLVGAAKHATGGTDAGRAYLISGASSGSASLGTVLATIDGGSAGDLLGYGLGAAGDLDGDGFADLIAGSIKDDSAHVDAGSVGLFLGPLSGALDAGDAWATLLGESSYDFAGYVNAGRGSINTTDGTDLLMGVYRDDDGGGNAGAIYVHSGLVSGATDLSAASGKRYGTTASDYAGFAVALLGDVDGDGFDDVATGAYLEDTAASSAGAAYVVYGPVTGSAPLSTADGILLGESSTAYAGYSLAGGGDLDGDGTPDLVVGSYGYDGAGTNRGRAYVVLGPVSSGGLGSAHATVTGTASYDNLGRAVAIVGDVDGDGNDDLTVSAPGEDWVASSDGATFLFLGPVSGSMTSADADAVLYGEAAADASGSAVVGGDGDGDGYNDLLISAAEADSEAGVIYLLRGGSW